MSGEIPNPFEDFVTVGTIGVGTIAETMINIAEASGADLSRTLNGYDGRDQLGQLADEVMAQVEAGNTGTRLAIAQLGLIAAERARRIDQLLNR